MAHHHFRHSLLAKASYMASPNSRSRGINFTSYWEGKNLWHFCNLPPEAGVAHCLSQPSIPHPCYRVFQEHAIHSSLSVSLSTDGHSMLLHPCGERHHLVASKSTTLLFKGTAQLSQNPFALFLKPLEKAPDRLTWVRCHLGPTMVAGVEAEMFCKIRAPGAQPCLWGFCAQKTGGRFYFVSWADTPKYVFTHTTYF